MEDDGFCIQNDGLCIQNDDLPKAFGYESLWDGAIQQQVRNAIID